MRWRLESPASRLFTQPFVQAQIKKTIKAPSTDLCEGIHRWPVNFPHKGPVTRKLFPFNDVIMIRILHQEGQNLINARSGNASREVVHLTIHPSEIRLWCWISKYLQKHTYRADIFSTSYEIVPRWKLQDPVDEKSTSRQMMTKIYDAIWRHYATTG